MPGVADAPAGFSTADLPDINVWVALGIADHPHHQRAQHWWNTDMAEHAVFCRTTALGLTRLLTNPTVMAGTPLSVSESWAAYQRFLTLPEISIVPEHAEIEVHFNTLIDTGLVTRRLWTDAYLAAFALSSGLRLVSFDSDFGRFPGLNWLQP
jgi:hypothetical protein